MSKLMTDGGWVMYVILSCSVVALTLIIERSIYFISSRIRYTNFLTSLKKYLLVNNIQQARAFLQEHGKAVGYITLTYLSHLESDGSIRETAVHQTATQQIKKYERNLSFLSTIANITPLIGLFGTVLGMIQCFQKIEALGGNANAQALAGGIWIALLTTAFGLFVAIPLMVIHHFFQTIVDTRIDEIEHLVNELDILFHHQEGNQSFSEKKDVSYEAI
jgi:biopolymer transport protein ExbB